MQPNIFSATKKRVTKLTDKARAALEDKLDSVSSKKRRNDEHTHTKKSHVDVGSVGKHPNKETPDQETTTHKRQRVEIEEVEDDEEDDLQHQARQLSSDSDVILIEDNDGRSMGHAAMWSTATQSMERAANTGTRTAVESIKALTPKEELGKW
jgi:hypothetical protein